MNNRIDLPTDIPSLNNKLLNMPIVNLDITDAMSGNFAPISETVANQIYIWAKEPADITIPSILCIKS